MEQEKPKGLYRHRDMNVKIENCGLYLYDSKEDEYFYLCRWLRVKKVETDILTGDVEVEIEYFHNQQRRKMTVTREIFVKNKLLGILPTKGIDVTDRNADRVLNYLLHSEEKAEHTSIHKQVGWAEINVERVFLHEHIIGSKDDSKYSGDLNIVPRGTFEKEREIIEEHVLGHYPLELAFSMGLSSPVASLLRKLLGVDVLFFHIYGSSSTGKTTALTVATAPFGYPSKTNRGLIKTWLATNNAILGYLKGIHGLPMAIDEASTKVNTDYTNMIYQIVDGIEKARMNRNGENKERGEWSGTVLSTAENSLLANSNQNSGLRVRLLEFGHIQWTESANHSETVKNLLLENYGNIGIKFAEYLMACSDEEIIEGYRKSKEYVKEKIIVKDEFTDRIADKIAVVYFAALLAKDALELDLNTEKILNILIDADSMQVEDRNLYKKAYQFLKSEITRNMNKFIHKDNLATYDTTKGKYQDQIKPSGEIIGKLEGNSKEIVEVLIPKEQLRKLLSQGGFTDLDIILTKWRDLGVIDADKGKFTKKRKLFQDGVAERVIVIKFSNQFEDEEAEEDEENNELKEKNKNKKKSKQPVKRESNNKAMKHFKEVGKLQDQIKQTNEE